MDREAPVLGRPSSAAAEIAPLRNGGVASSAAYRADGGDADWCALRAASIAGVRHRLSGQPGQDSFAWACHPDGLVVAVADGLGGVPGSNHTAGRAVTAAVDAVVAAGGPRRRAAGCGTGRSERGCWRRRGHDPGPGLDPAVSARSSWPGSATAPPSSCTRRAGGGGSCSSRPPTTPSSRPPPPFRLPGSPQSWPARPSALATCWCWRPTVSADPWRDGPATVAPALAAALARRPGPLELAQLARLLAPGMPRRPHHAGGVAPRRNRRAGRVP